MARGWESKSVEDQQAEAADRTTKNRVRLTAEQALRARELEGLRLSRNRIVQQIEASRDARHRKMLEDALADLDAKFREVSG